MRNDKYTPWTKTLDGFCTEASDLKSFPNLKVEGKLINLKEWHPHKNDEYEVMYWTKTIHGPGFHKTTYTIFND